MKSAEQYIKKITEDENLSGKPDQPTKGTRIIRYYADDSNTIMNSEIQRLKEIGLRVISVGCSRIDKRANILLHLPEIKK